LTEHWNGTSWSVVSSPNQGTSDNVLDSVAVASSNDVWAIGYYYNGTATAYQTLTEHWNGTSWSVVSSPNQGTNDRLQSVAAVSADGAWDVGPYVNTSVDQTLTEHWNGTAWSVVSSSNQGSSNNLLISVAAVSSNDVWAVGYYYNGSVWQTLVERYNPCP